MIDQPLVSVVISTYNRSDYVGDTVESVINQTYPNIDLIVVDDGSTDGTGEIIRRFGDKVRYVWQENAERASARNHGLRLAKGEFIAFLDSDDLWMPDKIEQAVKFLRANPRFGLVYTDYVQIDGEGRELRVVRVGGPSGRVTEALLKRSFVPFGAHLSRTSLIKEINGFVEDRQMSGSEDWEMWVRLSLRTEFAYDPRALSKIRTHAANTMGDADVMCRAMARASQAVYQSEQLVSAYPKSLRRMDAHFALANAISYCSQRDARRSVGFLRNAIATDPRIVLDPRYAYTIARLIKNGLSF